jgi:hypothetical protein
VNLELLTNKSTTETMQDKYTSPTFFFFFFFFIGNQESFIKSIGAPKHIGSIQKRTKKQQQQQQK